MREVPHFDMAAEVKEKLQESLRQKLMNLSSSYVLGSRLGPLINQSLEPGSDYRSLIPAGATPKLRTFVERYLDGVLAPTTKTQGADFIYEIVGALPVESPSSAGQLWKSFVAVNPTQRLIFDSSIGAIKVIPVTATLPDGCREITPVSLDEHRQVCINFTNHLKNEGRSINLLDDIAANYTEASYPQWLKILRSAEPPLDREWGEFRFTKIMELFAERLKALSVPASRIPQLTTEMARDRHQASTGQKATGMIALRDAPIAEAPHSKEKRARELLHLTIDRMDYDQLQKIQLPFSAFLDFLESGRH